MASDKSANANITVPEEFGKIINDFTGDILITFPEYSGIIGKWWSNNLEKDSKELFVFKHCLKVFPERFFDILYKNVEIFAEDSDINVEFLPGVVFKHLWSCDISEKTRETVWKYLQLILFAVIGSVNNSGDLGDTAKLFEAIDEEELKTKLQETLEGMQNLFDNVASQSASEGEDVKDEGINLENLPNAQDLHNHIENMMGGKLGKIAMELAEETATDLNLDLEDTESAKDVFQTLFKNPTKLMNMVKNIGSKLDDKIKSGELKESEIMEEGVELLNKMKNMPGLGNMQKMFAQMGIPGLGKGGKMNMSAMESQLNRNMNAAKMKERMRAKAEQKAKERELNSVGSANNNNNSSNTSNGLTDEEIIKVFSTGEKVERTPRGAKPPAPQPQKKKSGNKKK
jgi:hypothetical protein